MNDCDLILHIIRLADARGDILAKSKSSWYSGLEMCCDFGKGLTVWFDITSAENNSFSLHVWQCKKAVWQISGFPVLVHLRKEGPWFDRLRRMIL